MLAQGVRDQLRDYVIGNFLFGSGDIDDDASLIREGILDSTGVLEIVLLMEETFGIPVGENEVVPENFDSINAMVAFVEQKLPQAQEELVG